MWDIPPLKKRRVFVNLGVLERILLLNVLPKEGSYTTIKIVRELREELSFSEEEHKKLNFRTDGAGMTHWEREIIKDVKIGEKAFDILKDAFVKLEKQEQLTTEMTELYEHFTQDKSPNN